ncbi:hypothetical protein F5Y12DRAFT_90363 [Xylaria sp. FL1777]|nr:hypothetical protein F5Y12DRAFT_90363 [Xylaria sp. FL1777]
MFTMHIPSSTALPTTLLSLLLLLLSSSSMASAVSVSESDRSTCVRQNSPMLAEAAACGDRQAIQECFLAVPDLVTLGDLQSCFVEGHCTIAEAISEATIILQSCDASVSLPELRRRGPDTSPETLATPTSTSTPTSTPTPTGNSNSGAIRPSGIAVSILLGLVVVISVATLIFFYVKDRKARALAREKEEEEKRKRDQEASEAALRKSAQTQVARERTRRQQMEALQWAHRRAMESPRLHGNPFDDRSDRSVRSVRSARSDRSLA